MSEKEQEVFKKDIEIALVKKWWPLCLFICSAVTLAINGTHWFDNNVATKSDIQRIELKLNEINSSLVNYAQSNEAVHATLHRRIDSLGRIVSVTHAGYMTQFKRKDGSIGWKDANVN